MNAERPGAGPGLSNASALEKLAADPAFAEHLQRQAQASKKASASTTLVEIAQELYTFGNSTTGEPFALPRSGPKIVSMLRGSRASLRGQLARQYFLRNRRAAPQQALADALLVIEGMAQEELPVDLHLRVATHDGDLWLDLGDASGCAVHITRHGWTIEDDVPVLFKRTALTGAVNPERGGSLDDLWSQLNIKDEDKPLVAANLVACLHPTIPHPVLGLFGEQGTGKSGATRRVVSVVDPGPVPLRKPPRDAESWVTAAAGSWVVGLDNISSIPDWLSDSLCRAVTGDGDVRRRLYTDGDHAVFSFRRCIVINSIDAGALRGDLAQRLLPITLDPIPENHRLDEQALWEKWEAVRGRVLGAILDLAAGVAGVAPDIHLVARPRMADFARILASVDQVLGTDGLKTYQAREKALATDSLTDNPFIIAIMEGVTTEFQGAASELLKSLTPDDGWKAPKHWPDKARAVTQLLRRHAPALRAAGWLVDDDGGMNHSKILCWTLAPPEIDREASPQPPHSAGIAGIEYGQSKDGDHPDPDLIEADLRQATCRRCGGEGCAWCRREARSC